MLRTRHHTGTLPFKSVGARLRDGNRETYCITGEEFIPNYCEIIRGV